MKNKIILFIALMAISMFLFVVQSMLNTNQINESTTDAELKSYISLSYVDEYSETTNEKDNGRIYNIFLDFPYFNIPFADYEIFEIYKDAYNKIDFQGDFKRGDTIVYDYYKKRYNQLLNNERYFTNPKTGKKFFLTEYEGIKVYSDKGTYDLNNYTYYFFDMDEDNTPELGIENGFVYIFKYIPYSDEFILWYALNPNYQLIGSKKIIWIQLGTGMGLAFYKLDENGEEECSIFCYSTSKHNETTGEVEDVYIVGLPRYAQQNIGVPISEGIGKEAYRDSYGTRYFRVTGKQYDELTKDFWESSKLAEESIKEIAFTYAKLFADFNIG